MQRVTPEPKQSSPKLETTPVTPNLQIRKRGAPRAGSKAPATAAQAHTAGMWQRQDLNPPPADHIVCSQPCALQPPDTGHGRQGALGWHVFSGIFAFPFLHSLSPVGLGHP